MKNKNRILPHPILSVILTIIWLLLNNTIAPGHILLGAFLAVLIPWFTSGFWTETVCIRNPLIFLKFLLVVICDIVVANLIVAKQVIGPNSNLKPTFFKLPLDIIQPLGISVLASTISLTPGTVSCDLSKDKKYLIIHGLVVDDVEESIKDIKKRYEKPLMEVFKSC